MDGGSLGHGLVIVFQVICLVQAKYDSCLKRTIPYVSLCSDSSGRNICVDSIITNVYIRIPDDNVGTRSILGDVASKIGAEENDLILLDSKFVPITDDDDKG